jgi:hypothetical protein
MATVALNGGAWRVHCARAREAGLCAWAMLYEQAVDCVDGCEARDDGCEHLPGAGRPGQVTLAGPDDTLTVTR